MDVLHNNFEYLRSAVTSERCGEVSPVATLHGNHPPDTSVPMQDITEPIIPNGKLPPDEANASVLVIGWDGPDDPKNPKK